LDKQGGNGHSGCQNEEDDSVALLWIRHVIEAVDLIFMAERLGSGDGERKTLLTRQIAFEPLPASVLLNRAAERRGSLGAA